MNKYKIFTLATCTLFLIILGHTSITLAKPEHNPSANAALLEAIANNAPIKQITALIVKKNADVNTTDNNGNSVLIYACVLGNYLAAKLLIKHGAQVNATTNANDTALKWAAFKGFVDIVQLLLNNNADITIRDNRGNTALLDAATTGQLQVVEILLAHGANIDEHNNFGQTAIMIAKKYQHKKLVDFLRERGALEDPDDDIEDKETKIAAQLAKIKQLAVSQETKKELRRLVINSENSHPAEAGRLDDLFNFVLGLPWGKITTDNLTLAHAKQILDEDHYGLKKVKDEILDFIAARNFNQERKGRILCLIGPPGTGKTSIAKSVARALGRKYERIAVGGLHDESEIRGHNRAYLGARPGRIVQAIKLAGSMNPVIVIDEIDKLGRNSWHGDPAAAMLEVLDPEQNNAFRDNYLEIPMDLSQVIFIATANEEESIPFTLRDRMQIVHVDGYSPEEKLAIAEKHLLKQVIQEAGLTEHIQNPTEIISRDILLKLIKNYSYGGGVREVKRLISKLIAKKARLLLEQKPITSVTEADLDEHLYLGYDLESHLKESHHEHSIGVSNCLAANNNGGMLCKLEVILVPRVGNENPIQMIDRILNTARDSLHNAYMYVRSQASKLGIPKALFQENTVWINDASKTFSPTDGPSGGIGEVVAMVSAFTQRPVNAYYSMTGAINLRGQVLPIGGVKEKLLASKDNNMKHIIFPEENRKDVEKLDADVRNDIEIHFVKHVDEVLNLVLLPANVLPLTKNKHTKKTTQ